jgi:hypothetical protein
VKDLLSLPRLSIKEKGRASGVVKCDENLVRFVKERVELRFPSLAFTRKGALEYALLEWLEGRDRSDLLAPGLPNATSTGKRSVGS